MNKITCQAIKKVLTTLSTTKDIIEKIEIDKSNAKGLWFWKMRIIVKQKMGDGCEYRLPHIYSMAYRVGALNGEYLDKQNIEGRILHLS
jgi:hypothetical protein